jgi:hypothetical protein
MVTLAMYLHKKCSQIRPDSPTTVGCFWFGLIFGNMDNDSSTAVNDTACKLYFSEIILLKFVIFEETLENMG